MNKVICIGESLIDFMPKADEELTYKAKAGGAPSNVCACVAKLGGNGCYLGKLSTDVFSRFLLNTMRKWGVNTDYVIIDEKFQTALAFVTLDENGDREFSFYRNLSSDLMLNENEINPEMFDSGDILHFCSVGLVESPSKYAHMRAIKLAHEKECIISFDVNVRLNLWDNVDNCIATILEFIPSADIVKVTDEELELLTNEKCEKTAAKILFEKAKKCKILLVTKGKKGVTTYDRKLDSFSRDAVNVKVVDTTGAGDCFIGSVLYNLSAKKATLELKSMKETVDFASFGCGIVIGKSGAMEAMPTQDEISNLIKMMS